MTNNDELALAFDAFYRARRAGHDLTERHPVPECSSMAWEELADGTIRHFACLADYEGLVAVYREGAHGLPKRLEAWPEWLIGLDQDPHWRATCLRLKANKKRRQRRAQARVVHQLANATLPELAAPDIDLSVLEVSERELSALKSPVVDLSSLDLSDLELALAELDGL